MIDVKKELAANADQKYKEFNMVAIPGTKEMLGVRMPVLRSISKQICGGDWRSFLNEPVSFAEELMLRALVIANAEMSFGERLDLTRKFVPEIDNWGVCDIFCGDWSIKKGQEKERLWDYCGELIETCDGFKMRVSAVMMMKHFLDDEHIDDVLKLLTSKYHAEYYYKMGAAWALSECFIKYPERTEPMLFSDSLDKEIRNKAVQKISDSFRVSKEDKDRLKTKKKGCRS
ncbi:MAG: DNA alkylation repair protein [Candidatus Methanoplasma sp.]|nr:DNA alkylation repair protein [Candidatus Methanoplasma sp.]